MAAIKTTFGSGGSGLTNAGQGTPTLATALRDVAGDLAALRAAVVGITAKLDADGGVTDADYAATWDPAALTTTAA